ncbi:hypothetical protein FCV38_02485 [Clostridium sporogenes]|nr:hypothetical protein [Clostridium sporogenes]
MNKKIIQIKCVVKCLECKKEECIMSLITHTKEDFPKFTYKKFFELADNNYQEFEELIKNSLSTECSSCKEKMKIIEILDMKYI